MTKEELYQEIAKLGPEMSAGERMMKYFTGQEADCQPYITMMFDATFAKMWGYDMSKLNDIDTLCELVERKRDESGAQRTCAESKEIKRKISDVSVIIWMHFYMQSENMVQELRWAVCQKDLKMHKAKI